MKAPTIACAALLALLSPLGCERSRDGGSSPAPAAAAPTPEDSPAPAATDPQPASGGAGLSGGGTPRAATPAPKSSESADPGAIDWSTVAPAGERAARDALYGIIRIIDLERSEDSGEDILSFTPGAGPQDSEATVYSPITVHGATYHIDESMWLGLFEMIERRQDDHPGGFMARPLPDSRYGDGETSQRGDLLFALVVDDAARKSLKISWKRE